MVIEAVGTNRDGIDVMVKCAIRVVIVRARCYFVSVMRVWSMFGNVCLVVFADSEMQCHHD